MACVSLTESRSRASARDAVTWHRQPSIQVHSASISVGTSGWCLVHLLISPRTPWNLRVKDSRCLLKTFIPRVVYIWLPSQHTHKVAAVFPELFQDDVHFTTQYMATTCPFSFIFMYLVDGDRFSLSPPLRLTTLWLRGCVLCAT